jgi:hypothetical protein
MTSGTGTCSVKYDQAGDANYNAATQVTETVNAQKADQTITVSTHAPGSAAYNAGFTVAGSAPGGSVTFSSSGVCSNSGATFTMTSGTGTCSVKYDQAGSTNYNAAPQVTESVNAAKANQAIVITLHAPLSATYNTGFSVAANAPGGAVTFSSSGVCSNTGGTFTMTSGTGTCTVKYDQVGDANYNGASQLSETTTAQKAGQTITFGALPDRTVGDPDFTVGATASSGLAVSFAASGQCTVSGTTVHLTGAGSCTVTASQGGDSNYAAATDVPRTFQINSAASSSQITDTTTTCSQFAAGATGLGEVDYTPRGTTIKRVAPTGFSYWLKLSNVPAGSASFTVGQTIMTGNFSAKFALGGGSTVYAAACAKGPKATIVQTAGGVVVSFAAKTAGTYYLNVRYSTSAAIGQAVPNPSTVHYDFATGGVDGSTSGLDLKKLLTAAPAHSLAVRAALFKALRR